MSREILCISKNIKEIYGSYQYKDKAIKDFVGGKSTLQNELLGSAQAEFGSAPDKAEEGKLSVQLPCTEMTTVTLKGKIAYEEVNRQDVEALVDYIYSTDKDKGLAMDLDYILPFAAIPENGREINGLDDRSELAHRVMLTNLLRLMGEVKKKKHALKLVTRPTQMVLPLSPNHGNFGNDGLYSESNLARHIVQSMVF
ncbi:hypothetical protein PtA15_5A862 [Puccinia triticina]|uniref:Fatty acid synthase subunit alpha acyl carrier domain-containing protein n=1 Tax=Puccinia triticina TaxID=208348 RepID=A0ABY7CRD3_9BASI|nr:uncharacterized protein PtA15_5A862 [Puccinia triticina]WAQ85287.1 hypothetical protein PtA15_5A862 [Puccinia triticina]